MYCIFNVFATGLIFMVKSHPHKLSVCQKNGSFIVHAIIHKIWPRQEEALTAEKSIHQFL